MTGRTISHYRILEKRGERGMGVVHKARDTNFGRDVALKFLPPRLAASDQERVRFMSAGGMRNLPRRRGKREQIVRVPIKLNRPGLWRT